MVDDRSLKALDFPSLLSLLKQHCASTLGKKLCDQLRPLENLSSIHSRIKEVLEMKSLIETAGEPPVRGLTDIAPILERLNVEGSVLSAQELLLLHGQTVLFEAIKRFVEKQDRLNIPLLRNRVSRIYSYRTLGRDILRALSPQGEILDSASPSLLELRRRLKTAREKAKAVLEEMLHREELEAVFQERFVTIRNGRYVVVVKSDHRHRLQGIVHDQSQSRMSCFFEPLQVVSHNNEISVLMGEEKEEEWRVLARLSQKMREVIDRLRDDLENAAEIDFLCALAKFSIVVRAVEPILDDSGGIDLKEARHPLLILQKAERVVPISLRIANGVRTLIISGPNAGGKTAALKTLGLLTLMSLCGMPIPAAEGSKVGLFKEIFAMIGDEQDIEQDLSTFSSHLLHLNRIIERASPECLILLDELGVGTNAAEGCALAMAVLDVLRERGATVVVTTHFDRLKVYGYLHPDVENAAVEFDSETSEPKYTIAYGVSGWSNAFLIAEKFGFSRESLQRAKQYLDGSDEYITRSLEMLERLRASAEDELREAARIKEDALRERAKLKELCETLRRKRQEILNKAEARARLLVESCEQELKAWLRKQKEDRESSRATVPTPGYRKEIAAIKEKFFPQKGTTKRLPLSSQPGVGDRVWIEGLGFSGTVVKIERSCRWAEIVAGNRTVRVPLSNLTVLAGSVEGEKEVSSTVQRGAQWKSDQTDTPSEINVVGLTVDEAIPVVDKFIDRALLHGLERVRIVHGVGSGRLKKAIGDFLREHRRVKGISAGDPTKGGSGVTLVELS